MNVMRKARVNNKIVNVVTPEEYKRNESLYNTATTFIKTGDYILPIINKDDGRVGYYPACGLFGIVTQPSEETREEYSASKIIDFSEKGTVKELIEAEEYVKDLENEIIVNSDNIFIPPLLENDTAEMRGLKEAVISKNIDINAYASRMGRNFTNNKKIFKDSSVSMLKLKTLCSALDIDVTLTFKDKEGKIVNPIGREIVVDLISGGDGDE